jgi:hypothetical protein
LGRATPSRFQPLKENFEVSEMGRNRFDELKAALYEHIKEKKNSPMTVPY